MEHDGREGAVLSDIRTVAETGSTNADLLALARDGAGEGSWLRAEQQTAGRGREGRAWVSPVGNLYASTLVRLRASDPSAPGLALVAAVALHDAVAVFLPQVSDSRTRSATPTAVLAGARKSALEGDRLVLKWPNDLLLGGAKLSGILLEGSGDAVVAGFGVNIGHHPELQDRPTTSLAARGAAIAPEALLEVLAETFGRWLARWRGEGIAPVRAAWLERAHPPGTALGVRQPDGGRLDGLFDGLDRDGALLLRLGGGERRVIHAADVFLI